MGNPSAGVFFSWFVIIPTMIAFFWRNAGMGLSYVIQPQLIAIVMTAVLSFNFTWNPYFLPNGRLEGAEWIRYLTGTTYQYNMLMNTLFNDDIEILCQEGADGNLPLAACEGIADGTQIPGDALIESGDLSVNLTFWESWAVIIGMMACIIAGTYAALRLRLRALFRNIKSGTID